MLVFMDAQRRIARVLVSMGNVRNEDVWTRVNEIVERR